MKLKLKQQENSETIDEQPGYEENIKINEEKTLTLEEQKL